MRDLNYALKQLCHRNRDGAFGTQADRERILDLIADQLYEMGFRHMDAGSLKPKHVEALVARWLAEAISPGTIKNRMSALRWWAEKIGKQNVVARTMRPTAFRIASMSQTAPRRRRSTSPSLLRSATSTCRSRCACRPPSGYAARSRSRS